MIVCTQGASVRPCHKKKVHKGSYAMILAFLTTFMLGMG